MEIMDPRIRLLYRLLLPSTEAQKVGSAIALLCDQEARAELTKAAKASKVDLTLAGWLGSVEAICKEIEKELNDESG